jgi:hypothetical protein
MLERPSVYANTIEFCIVTFVLGILNITLEFDDSLEVLTEFTRPVILMAIIYHLERTQITVSKGKKASKVGLRTDPQCDSSCLLPEELYE